jgi:hypothetical protein
MEEADVSLGVQVKCECDDLPFYFYSVQYHYVKYLLIKLTSVKSEVILHYQDHALSY